MKIDIALSPVANLLAILTSSNPGLTITESQFTVGVPEAFAGTGTIDTQVLLTAVPNAGFSGTKLVKYTRPELVPGQAFGVAKDVAVSYNPGDTPAVILTKVAAALGLVESELEISDIEEAVNEDTDGAATITAKAGSLLYTGEYIVALTIPDTDVALEDVIIVDELDGFEYEA